MTREDFIKQMRQVGLVCRGEFQGSTEDQADIRKAIKDRLEEGDFERAKFLNENLRTPCGYDINEIVLAGALDGELYEYTCPKCNRAGVYRAPVFIETE